MSIRTIGFIFLSLLFFSACSKVTVAEKYIYTMNTVIEVRLYNADSTHLDNIKEIYDEYHKLSDAYNEYPGINNIYTLNNTKEEVLIDEKLKELLEYSLLNSLDSFNILSGGLTALWKKALETKKLPSDIEILKEKEIINNSTLVINGNYAFIDGEALIDLGGVAKGYATEKVYDYLKINNITSYLINAGNSNVLLGYKEKSDDFAVGLKNIDNTSYYKTLNINNKALVTSSVSEQTTIIDNKRYHHIIDLKTGYPANYYDIITLIGDNSALLDIYSTAFFSMDIAEITEIIKDLDIKIIIVKDGVIIYEKE